MDKGILAARRAIAYSAITSSVEVLAGMFNLGPEQVEALQKAKHRDPQISEVYRLEAMRSVLEALVEAGQAPSPGGEMDRQALVAMLESDVEGLTKTSLQALKAWAQEEEEPEGSEAQNLDPEEA